jgi:Uma2 family endonuclease
MTAIKPKPAPQPRREIDYPTGDGKPMAETELHLMVGLDTIQALRTYFASDPDVYVVGNNFVFWEEGNRDARVAPDIYVVFGVEKKVRDSYMAWLEGGKLPDVVIEVTSRKTRHEDTRRKRPLYEQVWRTAEYFQFDPKGEYLSPSLQGFRLVDGVYQPIPMVNDRVYSEQLGLDLVMEDSRLRLFDPREGKFLPTLAEATALALQEAQRAEQATQRAEQEAQGRSEAERRLAEANAEVARLRAELEAAQQKRNESAE